MAKQIKPGVLTPDHVSTPALEVSSVIGIGGNDAKKL